VRFVRLLKLDPVLGVVWIVLAALPLVLVLVWPEFARAIGLVELCWALVLFLAMGQVVNLLAQGLRRPLRLPTRTFYYRFRFSFDRFENALAEARSYPHGRARSIDRARREIERLRAMRVPLGWRSLVSDYLALEEDQLQLVVFGEWCPGTEATDTVVARRNSLVDRRQQMRSTLRVWTVESGVPD
jgi:hypothetical protein